MNAKQMRASRRKTTATAVELWKEDILSHQEVSELFRSLYTMVAVRRNSFLTWFILVILLHQILAKKNGVRFEKLSKSKEKTQREGKLFSLFNIVQFKNEGCPSAATVASGTGGQQRRTGTCYTITECVNKGGQASGNCAAGFGVCCLFVIHTATAAGPINQNCTYLQNPGYPVMYTETSSITYTLSKCSSDVCYLRLDFEMFTIAGVLATQDLTTIGTVSTINPCIDTLVATTTSQQVIPDICGQNTGQHIYLDIGNGPDDSATLELNFGTLPGGRTVARMWDIKVTQYVCGDKNAPPEGCLQYHTGHTGRFTTFNFDAASPLDNHLPNQQYSVCIRQEDGFCCVQYQVCPGLFTTMPIPSNPGFSLSTIATTVALFDSLCVNIGVSNDYIGIADIADSSSQCQQGLTNVGLRSRYCGGFFNDVKALANSPICDCTPPFSVEVFTNNLADLPIANIPMPNSKGVCLEWMQLPCTG